MTIFLFFNLIQPSKNFDCLFYIIASIDFNFNITTLKFNLNP